MQQPPTIRAHVRLTAFALTLLVLLGIGCVIAVFAVVSASSQTRLAVPSYQAPGGTVWNSWAVSGPASVGIMVANLGNGDDQTYHESVSNAIDKARLKGTFVLGYVYTSYGTRDPKVIRQKIDSLYQNYLVDGIFFDETPTDCNATNSYAPSSYLYYQALTNYVRQKQAGARLTVLNPGTYSPSDCWMSITNILMNWENAGLSTYQAGYVDYPWVHQYPADRFWHVLLGVAASDMPTALSLAKSRNAGWVYLSDSATNGYNQLPVYWSAETTAITSQGIQAPYATSWPDSSTPGGTTVNGRVSFRWRAMNGAIWQIFLDTDKNAQTGYQHANLAVGAEYMVQGAASGDTHIYRYAGTGFDWTWTEVAANGQTVFPDTGINLVMFDRAALNGATSLNYQIESLDASYNLLSPSYVMPLSLDNTSFVYDILNHPQ
jgi:Spherulation-specific family 4